MSTNTIVDALAKQIGELSCDDRFVIEDKDAYTKCLPEGVDAEMAEKVNAYNVNFVAASGIATGQAAAKVFDVEAEVDCVSSAFPVVGGSLVEHVVERNAVIAGEEKPYYLVSTFQMETAGQNDVLRYAFQTVAELAPDEDIEAD